VGSLDDVRALLEEILLRVERLEKKLESLERRDEQQLLALVAKLLRIGISPIEIADAVSRLKSISSPTVVSQLSDGISRAIVELLALKGPMSISQLTRELRSYRGRASRRVVSERVKRLREMGLVEVREKGREKVIKLKDL